MKKRLLSFISAAALVIALVALYACNGSNNEKNSTDATDTRTTEWSAQDEWSYISKKGAVIVGYIPSEPMIYSDEKGALVGFDSEVARIVCSRLGLNAVFMAVDEKSAQKMLESKEIDCIFSGFNVTEKTSRSYVQTDGYIKNRQVVVVGKDDAKKYGAVSSLKKAKLTATDGSDGEKLVTAKKLSESYSAAGSQKAALLRVVEGKADAAVVGSVTAYHLINTDKAFSGLAVLENKEMMLDEGIYYTGVFRKSGSVTAEKFNGVLIKLRSEGALFDIAEKYGIKDCIQK